MLAVLRKTYFWLGIFGQKSLVSFVVFTLSFLFWRYDVLFHFIRSESKEYGTPYLFQSVAKCTILPFEFGKFQFLQCSLSVGLKIRFHVPKSSKLIKS